MCCVNKSHYVIYSYIEHRFKTIYIHNIDFNF
jgi:hypothetical protein